MFFCIPKLKLENFEDTTGLRKIRLLNCKNEGIIWSTRPESYGPQGTGNELYFEKIDDLTTENTLGMYLYTEDLTAKSPVTNIGQSNSPYNNCPATVITTKWEKEGDQEFGGDAGQVFWLGIAKGESTVSVKPEAEAIPAQSSLSLPPSPQPSLPSSPQPSLPPSPQPSLPPSPPSSPHAGASPTQASLPPIIAGTSVNSPKTANSNNDSLFCFDVRILYGVGIVITLLVGGYFVFYGINEE
jgi:hypothetical protein